MRIEQESIENNIMIHSKNGGSAYAVYECFWRINEFGSDVEDSADNILVMSDFFDFDIILKIRDGYLYCETHTNGNGNHSYTVIYSFEDLKHDVVKKLNELIFSTEEYDNLTLSAKKVIINSVAWYYKSADESIPYLPYGITVRDDLDCYDISARMRDDLGDCKLYFEKEYKELIDITVWSMASLNIAIAIMNWDSNITAYYSVVDGKMLGFKPNTTKDLVVGLCELIRLSVEVKTGYRDVTVDEGSFVIGVNVGDTLPQTDEEINTYCKELGYNLEKFDAFSAEYSGIIDRMIKDFKFSAEDFGVIKNDNGYIIPKYLKLERGDWV